MGRPVYIYGESDRGEQDPRAALLRLIRHKYTTRPPSENRQFTPGLPYTLLLWSRGKQPVLKGAIRT